MRTLCAKALVGVSALALTVAGVAGDYSHGQNYYLHRGFATLHQLPRAGTGRLLKVSFFSSALNREANYVAYPPPGDTPARRYPVYHLLHGIVPMARAQRANGASVQYAIYPGGHDWSLWYPRLNQMPILASGAFTTAPLRVAVAPLHKLKPPAKARARRLEGGRRETRPRQLQAQSGRTHATEARPPRQRSARPGLVLIGALLLALVSAAMINLGFVLQHRGLAHRREPSRSVFMAALRSRAWLSGQALGWVGFAAQIVAVAIAPLSLIQAFAAGSLAVTVPLAARAFGYRVGLVQLLAVFVIAVSLLSLPIGFSHRHDHLHSGAMIGAAVLVSLAALALASRPRASTRAIAAGLCYGVADAAIKAESLALRIHGVGALLSGWTVLAGLATFGGFVCFQAALRDGPAVNTISLMTAFTALAALALGVLSFGESLGTSPAATVAHLAAIALVLASVTPLARVQQQLADAGGCAPQPNPGTNTGPPLATLVRARAATTRRPAAARSARYSRSPALLDRGVTRRSGNPVRLRCRLRARP